MKLNLRLLKAARHAQLSLTLSILLGLIGGILSILQAREISRAINGVFLNGEKLDSVSVLIVTILLIIVCRAGLTWAGEWTAGAAARKIKQALRNRLFTHILHLGPAYLRCKGEDSDTQTGKLVNLATEGIDALDAYFSQYLPQVALAALIPLSILVFVFPSDTLSGAVLLVTAPLMPLFMVLIGSAAEALTRKQWLGLSRMSAYFLDVLQGLTTLKFLSRSRDQIEVIKKVSEQYRQSTMSVLKVTFLSALVLELIATLSTAVVAVEVGIRLLHGKLGFEQAFFILLLAPEFYQPLRVLGTRFHAGMAGAEAARHIFEILDLPITGRRENIHQAGVAQIEATSPPTVVFKDVGFSYPDHAPALDGISLEIPSGKMTALIGESGAGKTTLTWLLLGLLRPQKGEIIADGKSLQEMPANQWREKIAWVPQNPYLFNDTIAANIRLANPDANDQAIQHAAHLADADGFINGLPNGYETLIGERGVRLSAGQAQRIALARAFLKDAPMIILDEATSHLDPEADARFQASLESLAHGRTMLVIAHRLSTLAKADQVIRLSHGRIDHSQVEIPDVHQGHDIQTTLVYPPGTQKPLNSRTSPKMPVNKDVNPSRKRSVESRLLKLLAPFWDRILLSIALGFATIASAIGLMATSAYIISAAALHPSIADLQVAIVGVRFFGLARGVFRYLERLVSHDVTFRLLSSWRVWFYKALEPLAPARLMRYHSGDLLTRVIRDIGSLESFYVRAVSPPLVALLVGLASILFLGGFGSELSGVLLVFLILAGIVLPLFVFIYSQVVGPNIIHERGKLSTLLIDAIQGMPDILIYDKDRKQASLVNQAGEQLARLQARMDGIHALQTTFGSLLANLAMLTILILAIQKVASGQLDGVLLGVVALTALTCFEAVQPLPGVAQNVELNRSAARRLYELVDSTPTIVDPVNPSLLPGNFDVEVKNLSFQYPIWDENDSPSDIPSFSIKDISFSLPQGKHIALIGPSGAGKTTLTNLLLRYWEYPHGSIRLGDSELNQYLQDDIRKRIAVISQNTYLFSASIKDNLLIACPEASDEEIFHAIRQAQIEEYVLSLPDGYHTWVGEHGLHLSAGERQRLAIARAFLKKAPLLILDEPTANLDPATELAVLNSIQSLGEGRSTITITQRMVGLENMDEILVMENGRIVERGNHYRLLEGGGVYRRMWDIYHQIL